VTESREARSEKSCCVSWIVIAYSLGASLALQEGEFNVLRALHLLIVLTLAAGQATGVLCDFWCHNVGRMSATCEHQVKKAGPGLVADDNCIVDGNTAVFVGEEARPSASPPHANGATPETAFRITPRVIAILPFAETGDRLRTPQPLVFALRI
jgi:hypothetical protein